MISSNTPLRVHRRWQVWKTAWMPVRLCQRGTNHHHHHRCRCPTFAHAGIHAANCLPHPKSHYIILSSCVYILASLYRSRGGLCVLMYHFFIAKMSLLAISCEDAADVQYRGLIFCLSLKQYEHSVCSGERSHLLNMGRSPHFESCVRVCGNVRVSALNMFSVIGWMSSAWCCHTTNTCVMTSSLQSLLGCHDVNDGDAGRTLRLCCFNVFFVLFFQHGQGVVYPLFMSTLVIQRKAI